jgi:hypothetical protein
LTAVGASRAARSRPSSRVSASERVRAGSSSSSPRSARAAAAGRAFEDVEELPWPDEPADPRLLDRSLQVSERDDLGEVEKGAGRGCDRHPLAATDVDAMESTGPVQANAGVVPRIPFGDRDVYLGPIA